MRGRRLRCLRSCLRSGGRRRAPILASLVALAAFASTWSGGVAEADTLRPFPSVNVGDLAEQINLARTVRGGAVKAHWGGDGQYLYYSEQNAVEPKIWRLDLNTGERAPVISKGDFARRIQSLTGEKPSTDGASLYNGTLEAQSDALLVEQNGRLLRLKLADGALSLLDDAAAAAARARRPRAFHRQFPRTPKLTLTEAPSPDGGRFLRIADNELRLRVATGGDRPLTSDTPAGVIWNPFTLRWSPDGKRAAAVQDDFRGLEEIPLIDWLADEPAIETEYYPPSGGPFPQGTIIVATTDAAEPAVRRISAGDHDHYLRLDRFSRDGDSLYYFAVSRDARHLEYRRADLASGAQSVVFEEESDTGLFYAFSFTLAPDGAPILHFRDGERFLWLSGRTGVRELYLYTEGGAEARQVTDGLGRVAKIIGMDADERTAFVLVQSDEDHPYDQHLHAVNLLTGAARRLTDGRGRRTVALSPDRRYAITTTSSPVRPTVTELISLSPKNDPTSDSAKKPQTLSRATFDDPSRWTAPEEIRVLAADGKTPLHGLLYKPPNSEPNRQYPLLEYIYAGPQAVWTPKTFLERGHTARALAKAGFVVLSVDGRGTPERSRAFQDYVYGRMGQVEIEDHAAAVRQLLAERSYLDPRRVGVLGTSFGGYYAIRAMLEAPDVYRAGVSSAPAYMPASHVLTPVENFMGLPEDNPQGYAAFDLAPMADRLNGPLLIITGTSDVNTPFGHALRYMEMFIDANKPVQMVVMPGRNHHFMRADDASRSLYWFVSIAHHFNAAFAAAPATTGEDKR